MRDKNVLNVLSDPLSNKEQGMLKNEIVFALAVHSNSGNQPV